MLKYLGFLWAFPVSLLAFVFYVGPLWALGWYKFLKSDEIVLCWETTDKLPEFVKMKWVGWAGHCFGNLVVFNKNAVNSLSFETYLAHEKEHARQCMKLGIFSMLMYALVFGYIKILGGIDAYEFHPAEIAARKIAGQSLELKK